MSTATSLPLSLGCAYHPESCPDSGWAADIWLMRETRVHIVELGESAWASLEPGPGEFRFEWLQRVIALLAEAGIETVLAAPVTAPPLWLHDSDARDGEPGSSAYCVNAGSLRGAACRLLEAMAGQFGANPHVIGWRLACPPTSGCTCARCQEGFQDFLKERYASLIHFEDNLLAAGRPLAVTDWRHIRIAHVHRHPLLLQEYRRFRQSCRERFLAVQEEALRPALPAGTWITSTNYGGSDVITLPQDEQAQAYPTLAVHQDLARFRHLQHPPATGRLRGYVASVPGRTKQDLGLARLRAWQALAHGADVIQCGRWRGTQPIPTEASLLGPTGQTRPLYDEIRWLGRDVEKVRQLVAGSRPAAEVALLFDEQSQWYVDGQAMMTPVTYLEHVLHYARPFARLNIPTEFIETTAPLRPYDLVFAPSLAVLSRPLAEQLMDYVRRGGRLVLSSPCGLVDEWLRPAETPSPGLLGDAAGVEVKEFYPTQRPAPVQGNWFTGSAHPWAEPVQPRHEQVVVVARFGPSNGWLDDQAAITVAPFGRGLIYYVGAFLDESSQHELLKHIAATAKVQPLLDMPEGVEVRRRIGPDRRELWFICNHRLQEQTVNLPWSAFDHLAERLVPGELTLMPYGVALLTRQT